MTCKVWRDEWVARLYGELDPAGEGDVAAHLEECAACRDALAALDRSRALLRDAAPPLPAMPRVLVLGGGRRPAWSPGWAFAAGTACALALFGVGWLAGTGRAGDRAVPPQLVEPATATLEQPSAADAAASALGAQLAALEQRLTRVEGASRAPADLVSAAALRDDLERLERRVNNERVRDLEYVMRSLTASELRTGTWLDQTREALTMLAMQHDPRLADR